jgi:histidinol phosphatase-like PHP family hydrolase
MCITTSLYKNRDWFAARTLVATPSPKALALRKGPAREVRNAQPRLPETPVIQGDLMVADGNGRTLELLLIADVHLVREARHECPIPARNAGLGLELVRRARLRAQRERRIDAVMLMGDLVDNGEAVDADRDLRALTEEIGKSEAPAIVVPGNHDGSAERLLRLFGDQAGVHRVNGYQLITCVDEYGPTDEATRSRAGLQLVTAAAEQRPDEPIIVLQHNPVHPPIESSYPYNLTNAAEVMGAYERAGVLLSISAHYHPGLAPEGVNGVQYVTCPALCEAPFRFARLSVRDRSLSWREEPLMIQEAPVPLVDHHMHTHYAYCADDVHPQASIERAELFGLQRIYFTEHAGQLYLPAEDYWGGTFRRDAGIIPRERRAGRDRMARYRKEMAAFRSARVGLGLEVELDANRELTLLDEDCEGWDVLVGAVHVLPAFRDGGATASRAAREFMDETERIARVGIDILAHPFRIFRRGKRPVPTELYEPVAELLAAHDVAAEVNYHSNEPDPRFFERCLAHGVKIAFGSDAHGLWEIGELQPHLDLLRKIVPDEALPRVLYNANGTGRARRQNRRT